MLEAVVFDFDGVLIDSESTEFESHRRIFERCGAVLTVDEWCGQIGLWSGDAYEERWCERLRALVSRAPSTIEYQTERRVILEGITPVEPMRGVREVLAALAKAGIPAAVASTSPRSWVIPASERIGVRNHFSAIVCGDEVARRKPAPDVYLEAARRLGVESVQTVAVEDSAPGLEAARAAGMKTVAIPHALTASHDLAGADLRVAHAGELTLARLAALVA